MQTNPVTTQPAPAPVAAQGAAAQPAKAPANDSKIESMAAGAKPAEKGCLAKTWEVISNFFKNLVIYIKARLGFAVAATPAK